MLDRVRASRTATATTVTLGGNGRLTPAEVTEARRSAAPARSGFPERVVEGPAQTSVEGPLVKRVRVAVNSREPLVTRVVMEVADGATYHVERAGTDGSDLAVVFEPPQSPEHTCWWPRPAPSARRSIRSRTFRSSRRSPTRHVDHSDGDAAADAGAHGRRPLHAARRAGRRTAPAAARAASDRAPAAAPRHAGSTRSPTSRRRRRRAPANQQMHLRRRREAIQGHADHAGFLGRRPPLGAAGTSTRSAG